MDAYQKPMKKVFVTGANGFIGRYLVQYLVDEGFSVGALVRQTRPGKQSGGNVTYYTSDIRNYEEVTAAFRKFGPEAVIHLVTYYAVMHRADEIGVMLDTNVKGTINLLEASRESGTVQLFVNTSTCAVYGQKKSRLTEGDKIAPQNLYALTKLNAEEACGYYAEAFSLPCVTLRLFPPYGPGDHERRLIPYVIRTLMSGAAPDLTTGRQEWDFVYIDDIVRAFVAAVRSAPYNEIHPVINIGTGSPVSVHDAVEKVKHLMGSGISLQWGTVPHRPNEVWYNSADIAKAERVLGWKPSTGIDQGMENTVHWFAAHRG